MGSDGVRDPMAAFDIWFRSTGSCPRNKAGIVDSEVKKEKNGKKERKGRSNERTIGAQYRNGSECAHETTEKSVSRGVCVRGSRVSDRRPG